MRRLRKNKLHIKKRGWQWWYPKLDDQFSLLIRSKAYCEMCGSTTNQMQCAHIITRSNHTIRWDPMNAMCLCSYCHRFKWHDSPLEAHKWFVSKWPDRYEYLMKAKNILVDRVDEDYRLIKEKIEVRDIRGLMISVDKL